jgi:hypothetical protein
MHKLPLTQLSNHPAAFRPNRHRHLWGTLMRGAALFAVAAATVVAQETAEAPPEADNGIRGIPVTLAGQFFDHDFVNYSLFANAIYDTNVATLQGAQSVNSAGFGWSAGGGVSASHKTRNSVLSLSYRGDYRHYGSSGYGSGTDQNLALDYSLRLARRWSMSVDVAGGILLYGGGFYSVTPSASSTVVTNPFSPETRFLSTGINFTYQQTRRLSYVIGGQFSLSNYNYAGAINSVGGSGLASVVYRLTARTSVAGTYSHTYYTYGQNSGQSTMDGGSLTLSHTFPDHWQASLTAGVTRSHSTGNITIPVSIIVSQQTVNGYVIGPYDQVSLVPSFQASLTRYRPHSTISISAGQGVQPGNGVYLTSRSQFLNGTYSHSTRRSNISFGGGYFRLSSVSNTISQAYNTGNFSASYSYVVRRHISADFRYDLISYGGLFAYGRTTENRLTVGLSFSSQSIPLTLF